jgi:hypothetical protein
VVIRRLYGLVMFSTGALLGWLTCILMAAMAGKQLDKFIEKEMVKNPIKVTED